MYYVYSGRFQPFNKLNEQELLWLCSNIQNSDKIIIGIVNYNPKYPDPSDRSESWTQFKIEYNPLSFWERYELIQKFINIYKLKSKISAIVPLPRPSVNMERARNYLPSDRIMCLTVINNDISEENKKIGMEQYGEIIKIIPSYTFDKELTIISPELIFSLIALDSENWHFSVSDYVRNYFRTNNIKSKVCLNLSKKAARSLIFRIYNQTTDKDAKMCLYNIIKIDFPDISEPLSGNTVNNDFNFRINTLKDLVNELYKEMVKDVPLLKENAPHQYNQYQSDISTLEIFLRYIENKTFNDSNDIKLTEEIFNSISERWRNRNR